MLSLCDSLQEPQSFASLGGDEKMRGIWNLCLCTYGMTCRRELLSMVAGYPGRAGSSGRLLMYTSSYFLNAATSQSVIFLMYLGTALNSFNALTTKLLLTSVLICIFAARDGSGTTHSLPCLT